jgi:hypothetical protein
LAYYLLIKSYLILECYYDAKQTLSDFEKHLDYILSISSSSNESLKIELLLFKKANQIVQEKLIFIGNCHPSTTYPYKIDCNSDFQTPVTFSSIKQNDEYIIEHRHDSPKDQQEYDKRFGLIVKY